MKTYEKTFTQHGRNQHAKIARWLGTDVAFISEEKEFNRFAIHSKRDGLLIGISFDRTFEMFTIQFLNENDLTPAGIATVHVHALFIGEMFVSKRVRAAVEMLKGF